MRPLSKRAADGALPGTRAPSWVYACVRGVVRAVFWPAFRALYGFRITGERQQALKALRGGGVVVCNHVHVLDCVMMNLALPGKRVWVLSLPENFNIPVAGRLVRLLGGLAVPASPGGYRLLYRRLRAVFANGQVLQVYPEGELVPWCGELRGFHPGAFCFAARFGVPVVPFVLRRTKGALAGRGLELCALSPVYAPQGMRPRQAAAFLEEQCRAAMQQALARAEMPAPRAVQTGRKSSKGRKK